MKPTKYHQFAWCLYDWAHSVWPVLIITFIFSNYFVNSVASNPVEGNIYWANTLTISGIIIAILAPITGVISDTLKNSLSWFRFFTAINIICAYLLWFVQPSPDYMILAMTLCITGSIGFEVSSAFYNSYLVQVTTPKDLSKISGFAWGLGYIAGIFCLGLCLVAIVLPDQPLFGLITKSNAAHIRMIGPIVGTWYLAFSLPILFISSEKSSLQLPPLRSIVHQAFGQVRQSIKKTESTPYIYYFLVYRMIYTDGINTLFSFAGIYAASTFNMGFEDIIYFGIACNLTAGLGCFLASYSDSVFGEKKTIMGSLAILSVTIYFLLTTNDLSTFWSLALIATTFVGPLQTSSRSLMAKMCPLDSQAEFFGLYALSGRITAFLGPLALGFVTSYTGSQTLGMSTIIVFLIIGLIGLAYVNIPEEVILPKEPR